MSNTVLKVISASRKKYLLNDITQDLHSGSFTSARANLLYVLIYNAIFGVQGTAFPAGFQRQRLWQSPETASLAGRGTVSHNRSSALKWVNF